MLLEPPPKQDEEQEKEEDTEELDQEEEDPDLEDLDEEERREFMVLNRQLDELNKALDCLEERNDAIHLQLKELLADSRQARQEIQESSSSQ